MINARSLPCFTVIFRFAESFRSPQGWLDDRARVRKLRCLAFDMELHGGVHLMRCTPRCLACTQDSHKASTSAGLRKSVPPVWISLGFAVLTRLNATACVRTPLPACCSSNRTSVMASKSSPPIGSGGRGRSAHHLLPDCVPFLGVANFAGALIPWVASPGESFASASLSVSGLVQKRLPFLAFIALLAFVFAFALAFREGCRGMWVLEAHWTEVAIDCGV